MRVRGRERGKIWICAYVWICLLLRWLFFRQHFSPSHLSSSESPHCRACLSHETHQSELLDLGHRLHLRDEYSLASESIQLTIVQSPLSSPRLDSRVNGLSGWDVEIPQEETSPEDLDHLCTHLQLVNIYSPFIILNFFIGQFHLACLGFLIFIAYFQNLLHPSIHPSSNHLLNTPACILGAEDVEMTYVWPLTFASHRIVGESDIHTQMIVTQ